jgi:hypothetical protein
MTIAGQMRHAERALIVVFHRSVARPVRPYLLVLNSVLEQPKYAWLDRIPTINWVRLGLAWFVVKAAIILIMLLANHPRSA